MAQSMWSRVGGSPLGRAGLATVSILALAGLVQFGLPFACDAGAAFCKGELALAEPLAELEVSQVAAAELPDAASSMAVASLDVTSPEPVTAVAALEQAVLPGTNDLIAQTFSLLEVELSGGTQAKELTSRTVRTVAINADGNPAVSEELRGPAPLVASVERLASSEPMASSEPAVSSEPSAEVQVAEADVSSEQPAEERGSSMAYAPASGDVANVTGKGANVRSVPAVGGSDVLFALPGGVEVTIVEMRRGWARIVDPQGRSGWIYGQYLDRS